MKRIYKILLFCVLYFSLTSIVLGSEPVNLLNHYNIIPEFKSNYKNTIFTPVLDCDIVEGKNIIYCSAFQKAWDEITAYEGETIEVKDNKIVSALNEKYIKSGRDHEDIKNEKIFEEVAKELKIKVDDLWNLILLGLGSNTENAIELLKKRGWKAKVRDLCTPKNIEIPKVVTNYNITFFKINDLILPFKKVFSEFIKDYRQKMKLATELIILSYINTIIELNFDVYEAPPMKFNKKSKKVKSFVITGNNPKVMYDTQSDPYYLYYYYNMPPDYYFSEKYKNIPLIEPLPEGFIIEICKTKNRDFKICLAQFKNCNNLKKAYEHFLKLTNDGYLYLYYKEYYDDPLKFHRLIGCVYQHCHGREFLRMPVININGFQKTMNVNNKDSKITGYMGINFNMYAENILKSNELKKKLIYLPPSEWTTSKNPPVQKINKTQKYDVELNSPFFVVLCAGKRGMTPIGDQIFFMAYIANDELMVKD